jgi:hypothetical protein
MLIVAVMLPGVEESHTPAEKTGVAVFEELGKIPRKSEGNSAPDGAGLTAKEKNL